MHVNHSQDLTLKRTLRFNLCNHSASRLGAHQVMGRANHPLAKGAKKIAWYLR
jgi:hypothetical protein